MGKGQLKGSPSTHELSTLVARVLPKSLLNIGRNARVEFAVGTADEIK